MQNTLLISHVVISIILGLLILMQNKEGGLGAMMGGSNQSFQATKRGAEKVVYVATMLFAFLFLVNALLFVLI